MPEVLREPSDALSEIFLMLFDIAELTDIDSCAFYVILNALLIQLGVGAALYIPGPRLLSYIILSYSRNSLKYGCLSAYDADSL